MSIPDYTAQTASTYKANIDETIDNTLIPNTTGGTADAYTATLGLTAYESGRLYVVRLDRANTTTTPTINFDSIGAKTIKHDDGSAMTAGEFRANQYAMFVYDGTDMLYIMPGDVHYATGGAYIGGTATANLLDDCEKGTFSPSLTTSGTDFDSVTYTASRYGTYTKLADRVAIQLYMQTASVTIGSASGLVRFGNLPFTAEANNFQAVAVAAPTNWGADHPNSALVIPSTSALQLQVQNTSGAGFSDIVPADVATGAGGNSTYIGGSYKV